MTDPSVLDLALLALVGLVAGAVNTVAGAGSLLLLPVLMWTGLPADAANATNRIGILAQTTMAVVGYHRAGQRIERHGSSLWMRKIARRRNAPQPARSTGI